MNVPRGLGRLAPATITDTWRLTRSAATPAADRIAFRPAIFDRKVLALDVAGLTQALVERSHKVRPPRDRCGHEKPDHRHRPLLRARRERPGNCCSANKRDELAPPHVEHAM